jgi:glycosyltransferase 2 family protein
MRNKIIFSLVLGVAFSAVALYAAFKNVPVGDLKDAMTAVDYRWALPSTLAIILSFIIRVIRWRIILAADRPVGFWQAFHPLMIGFMLNCIMPARIGEIARPVILKKNSGMPFTTGMATVAAERVFDMIVLMAMFAWVLVWVRIDPDFNVTFGQYRLNHDTLVAIGGGMLKLSLVLLVGIAIISIDAARRTISGLIKQIPQRLRFLSPQRREMLSDRIFMPLIRLLDGFAAGLALVKQPGKMLACLVLSLAIWALVAMSFQLLAMGAPGVDLSYQEYTAVMVIICFFVVLPSVPGYWGLWEAGGVFALALFGVAAKDAAGFTLANHVIQVIPVIIIGLLSALFTGINLRQTVDDGTLKAEA